MRIHMLNSKINDENQINNNPEDIPIHIRFLVKIVKMVKHKKKQVRGDLLFNLLERSKFNASRSWERVFPFFLSTNVKHSIVLIRANVQTSYSIY